MRRDKSFYCIFCNSVLALAVLLVAGIIALSLGHTKGGVTLLSVTSAATADTADQFIPNEPQVKAVSDHTINKADNSVRFEEWQTVRMRVTAYCPCLKCCGKSDGITASGYRICPGDALVAADKKYPFGTEMIIDGYNNGQTVKVFDRGGSIRENRLDVLFHSHEKAMEWGVRYIDVKVRSYYSPLTNK